MDNKEGIRKEQELIQEVCNLLHEYNVSTRDNFSHIVSELCKVDEKEMMTDRKNQYNIQARWLYWYALRYMTNESYSSISNSTKYDRHFTVACVCYSIKKMSDLISANTIWTKRWTILKRIIKESADANTFEKAFDKELSSNNQKEITIKITHPKGVKIELKEE